MPDNTAAWLTATGQPLVIDSAPYPSVGPSDVLVAVDSVALNPVDFGKQFFGHTVFPDLPIPSVIGADVAGTVVSVGDAASTHFAPGDRVVGCAQGAFQRYTIVKDHMACRIPASLAFEQACVLPLAFITALMGLFHKSYLALEPPNRRAEANGKAVLIWGGATSVGCNAVQLAAAAGYEVYSTASPKNFDYVRSLGATQVFDYSSPTAADDLAAALDGKTVVGALAIGGLVQSDYPSIIAACAKVLKATKGRPYIALTMRPTAALPEDVEAEFYLAVLDEEPELGHAIFRDYLSWALESGTFKAAPPAEIVGGGLEGIQAGLARLPGGKSAKKFVVRLGGR